MVGDNNKSMQEQKINNHPPLCQKQQQVQQYKQLHPPSCRNLSTAVRSQKLLHRYLPLSFYGINSQFQHSNFAVLSKANPLFNLQSSLYDRQRLSIERQLMYCRGLGDQLICDSIVQDLIKENLSQKGYINKKGNKSVILNQLLIYVHQQCIKAIQLPDYINNSNNKNKINKNTNNYNKDNYLWIYQESMYPITLLSFPTGTNILQLQQLTQNNNLNSKFNHLLIVIRLSRQIVIANLSSGQILSRIQTNPSTEFIACKHRNNINGSSMLETVEYDGCNSVVKLWDLTNLNQSFTKTVENQFKISETLVHSLAKLSNTVSLLATYHDLKLYDSRLNQLNTQYQTQKDRILSIQRLNGNYTYSPYIAVSQTRCISLFDIRNLSQPILAKPHYCEQAPPQNITYFDGFSEQLHKPLIMCWSPYQNGSVLITDIDFSDAFNSCQQISDKNNRILGNQDNIMLGKYFKLLPHQIALNNNNPKQPLQSYIESISLYNYCPSSSVVLSISNQGTINMQLYNYDEKSNQYFPQDTITDPQQKQISNQQQLQRIELLSIDPWFKSNLFQKYFSKSINRQQLKTLSKHTNHKKQKSKNQNKSNKKNENKSDHKVQNLSDHKNKYHLDSISNNHSEDLLFQAQFENQQHCQQSYHKRKLNFANLTRFYQTLQIKANQPKPHINRSIELQSSLVSTQTSSENYSLSQSFYDDSFTTNNLHNKKTLNSSIVDKLKSQWDQ